MKKKTSCADLFEADALSVNDARSKIFNEINPITQSEKLALRSCLNRYLSEDINSPIDVPSHTNSAMDGYAIAGDDLPNSAEQSYQVVGIAYAGKPTTEAYVKGQVIRIMTGAVMPADTDTVIMQEQVELIDETTVRINSEHKKGQNVRQAGEDIAKGSIVLKKGRKITSADLGIIASLGVNELRVFRRPRVAFFSTGDELRSIGETLKEGEIYDSNRYTLFGMLSNLDVEVLDMGVIEDNQKSIREAFINAAEMADIVITSGGVSVGEADYIKPTLKELGETHFWKIRMKPGRPLTFGTLNKSSKPAWFFGLPGNPVAVMVTFSQLVQPAISFLASGTVTTPLKLQAKSASKINKLAGRTEYLRGIYQQNSDGVITVERAGKQGSGILTSMSIANCFIVLDEESTGCEENGIIDIRIF